MNLTLIRGVPGSGKSTLAAKLADNVTTHHFEADMYFMRNGVYHFDGMKIGAAHQWCQDVTYETLGHGLSVIVSNTFTTNNEMKPYFEIAKLYKILPQVIHCQNEFGSVHGVPPEVLEKMRRRFSYDLSDLYGSLK